MTSSFSFFPRSSGRGRRNVPSSSSSSSAGRHALRQFNNLPHSIRSLPSSITFIVESTPDGTVQTLLSAIQRDDLERLNQLLEPSHQYGPEVLARCLFVAVARGRLECTRLLLKAGACTDFRGDKNGNTPLILATRSGETDIVSALISAGCDVNKPSNMARSRAIHWAVSAPDCDGSMSCLRQLLGAGADVEARMSSGRTPVMMAARAGFDEALIELIKCGANVNEKDNDRFTALHLAAQEGCDDCARHLVVAGSDIMAETRLDDTPLSLAARNGHEQVVRLLVEAVDDPTIVAPRNGTIGRARRGRRGQPMTPVHWAAAGGHARCVAAMMTSSTWQKVADTPTSDVFEVGHFVSPSGTTPLMLAANAGSSDTVRELLTSRHDVVVDRQDKEDMTALLYAVQSDHVTCVERLLLAGANQDGVMSSRPTGTFRLSPALLAVTSGSVTSLRLLLQAGCRFDLRGRSSPTDEDTNLLDHLVSGIGVTESDCSIRKMLSSALPDHHQEVAVRQRSDDVAKTIPREHLQPTTMTNICRRFIRRHLVNEVRTQRLFLSVPQLPLPDSLKRFLLLSDLETV